LRTHATWQDVRIVRSAWRIDQHWWRTSSVSRIYYRITTEASPVLTIYRDLQTGTWSRQEY
jgi:hypothetical protein